MAAKNEIYNRPWSDEENRILVDGYNSGKTIAAIQAELQYKRGISAIYGRLIRFRKKGIIKLRGRHSVNDDLPSFLMAPHVHRKVPKFDKWDFSADNLELPRAV